MKQLLLVFLGLCLSGAMVAQSAGVFGSYVDVDGTRYVLGSGSGGATFNGYDFGDFAPGSTLNLTGGAMDVYRENNGNCGAGNICSGTLIYQVKQGGTTVASGPVVFSYETLLQFTFCGQDDRWSNTAVSINLLAGLGVGSYTFEVILDATGSLSSTGGCSDSFIVPTQTATFDITAAAPVNWESFTATSSTKSVVLDWATAQESNNEYFVVEHQTSADKDWAVLAEVAGKGTTNKSSYYTHSHASPAKGSNYYRIKQVDFDGTFSYSNIVTADWNGETATIRVTPNPVSEQIVLTNIVLDDELQVTITDLTGRVLLAQNWTGVPISVRDLAAGLYFIRIIDKNGVQTTQQLLVQ